MISERMEHPKLWLCRLALWLLWTRIGTLVVCGRASLSKQFPFLQSFPQISPQKREEIVTSWSCSSIKLLRILFLSLKILVLFAFFTQVLLLLMPNSCMAILNQLHNRYQGGIMTAMSKVVANFEESGYGAIIQTPSLHPGIFSAIMPWTSGADIKTRMRRFSRTAVLFALARDRTTSGKVDSPSSITCNREGKTLKVNRAGGGNGGREEFEAFVAAESSRDLGDLSTLIGSAHQMGSCRMGVDPGSSAVDPTGESWEAEGLFVADSSVFPTALGVNPMLTVQAIAYCTAQHVLRALKTR